MHASGRIAFFCKFTITTWLRVKAEVVDLSAVYASKGQSTSVMRGRATKLKMCLHT